MRIEARERRRLERLCRDIKRPAFSDERIEVNGAGQVELEPKTPWPRVVPQEPPAPGHAATEVEASAECEHLEPVRARPQRMGWARLLKRVFDIDLQRCPRCGGGQVKSIAAILERAVIGKILTHVGLEPQPPPRSKARETGHEFAARAGVHAGTRPVACSLGEAARATCPSARPSRPEPDLELPERQDRAPSLPRSAAAWSSSSTCGSAGAR